MTLFVPGTPQSQGSAKAFIVGGHAKVTHSNAAHLNPWRADVHAAVREEIGDGIVYPDGPVVLAIAFVMPRRVAEPKRVTPPHLRAPDIDKLARAILDSVIGLVYADDSQVIDLHATKRTAEIGEQPGVFIDWSSGAVRGEWLLPPRERAPDEQPRLTDLVNQPD